MIAQFSPLVVKDLEKIYKKNKKLFQQIEKQITRFEQNPKHPSLRTHKLTGNMKNLWSISISEGYRMVYILLDEGTALFVKIGTHAQIYSQ